MSIPISQCIPPAHPPSTENILDTVLDFAFILFYFPK